MLYTEPCQELNIAYTSTTKLQIKHEKYLPIVQDIVLVF